MNDDEYRIRESINRIRNRVEKISILKARFDNEMTAIVDEAKSDIKSLQMQLDANHVSQALSDKDQNKK